MEAIVRNVACEKNTGAECRFLILGGNKNDILILGDIPAHDLQLGTSYSQGVRDLMVLKNGLNDFDYDVYTWKSEQGRYEPAD